MPPGPAAGKDSRPSQVLHSVSSYLLEPGNIQFTEAVVDNDSFTLAQEARNTERNGKASLSRFHPGREKVNFVSAGVLPKNMDGQGSDQSAGYLASVHLEEGDALGYEGTSSEASDEVQEVLLFGGRDRPRPGVIPQRGPSPTDRPCSAGIGIASSFVSLSPAAVQPVQPPHRLGPDGGRDRRTRHFVSLRRQGVRSSSRSDGDSVLSDYINNVDQDSRLGQGDDEANVENTTPPSHQNAQKPGPAILKGVDHLHLTSASGVTDSPKPAGSASDSKYQRSFHQNASFEDQANFVRLDGEGSGSVSGSDDHDSVDSEDQANNDLLKAFSNTRNVEAVPKEKQPKLTDEEIAERLAKQEELGLGSAELVLFDGLEDFNERTDVTQEGDEVAFLRGEARRYAQRKSGRKSVTSTLADLPDLQSTGDQYGDFDIMDRERPSLQNPRKKLGRTQYDMSDTDLETEMLLTWEKDRSKKRVRKQQREAMRAQGLLGKGGNLEMKAKYPEGMAWESIREELRSFLVSEQQM